MAPHFLAAGKIHRSFAVLWMTNALGMADAQRVLRFAQ